MSEPWILATWNVNSLRMRADAVAAWLASRKPSLLALQELKLTEADFPSAAFADYRAAIHGQKT